MKQSKYNYIIEKGGMLYCFNGISKNYLKLSLNQQSNLNSVLKTPDNYKDKLPKFYKLLVEGKFIIENDQDELISIRTEYHNAVNHSKHSMLTILPTFGCNFSCWYCVQDHRPTMMKDEVIEKVKKHISFILENEKIEIFHIEWFGGEPFLGYKKIIKPITLYAKEQCMLHGIKFTNSATTNGYLIDETIARELDELDFEMFQITIDGDKEHHDNTRVSPTESSFDRILHNINLICNYSSRIKIILRINYDNQNLIPDLILEQLDKGINLNHRDKIELLLRKVWQVDEVFNAESKIQDLIEKLENVGFKFRSESDLVLNNVPCYVSNKKMKLITPNGGIEKCTARENYEENILGNLKDDGSIQWVDNLQIPEIFANPLFENEMCLTCKQLPICMGPCPKDIDFKNTEYKAVCKKRSNDIKFEDSIVMWCESVK